jgi:membrane fusion protein, multidrug efflux system
MPPTEAIQRAPSPAAAQTRGKRLGGLAAVATLAGLAYLLANWWTAGRFQVTTEDAYVAARAATLSPKIGGYITEIAVADNAAVKAGDLIARIDAGDYQLAVRAARDATNTQRATIARIVQQTAAQHSAVAQAQAQLLAAKAAGIKASQDMKRQTELATRKINSAQALDAAQAAHDQAKANVTAAEAALAAASGAVGVFEAQRLEAESLLRQGETVLAKAERDLTFTALRAPFDGVIGNRSVQVGDYLQPAQRLASLVPADALYIDANFKETQLARLKPGQRVRITVDADADRVLEGVVESFAPASGSVFSLLPPDNATGNFTKIVQRVPVRIALPSEARTSGLLRPGMSVVVSVNTKPGTERAPATVAPGAPVAAAPLTADAPRAR